MNDDSISRQAAIDFIDAGRLCNPNEPRWSDNEIVNFLKSRPSAHRALDEWCTDCKEYDQERHCCPRFNRVIREAMKDAQPDMLGDGTLIVTVPKGTEVGRVLVQEEGTHNGALYYTDPQPEQRWIPVTEGLPGYGEKVLCCVDGRIYIDERELIGWRYRFTEYDAWMPLPEPWKGEEDE